MSTNYIKNSSVYILNDLNANNTNHLIGTLHNVIENQIVKNKKKEFELATPYDIKTGIIDIIINSYGGTEKAYLTIKNLLNIAKSKNIIIRTNVVGYAGGYSSLLALQGTPGFRIMNQDSYYYAPIQEPNNFGYLKASNKQPTSAFSKDFQEELSEEYKTNSAITQERIDEFFANGELGSKDCLNYGLCDWVLLNNGLWVYQNER